MKRSEKVAILSRVLQGETHELRKRKANRGRPWTEAEMAEQQAYLNTLCPGQTVDFITRSRQSLFGRYDVSEVAFEGIRHCRELPNGWKVYKQPAGQ